MTSKFELDKYIVQVIGSKSGTGFFILPEEGLILTCAHVVGEQKKVKVVYEAANDSSLTADVISNWYPEVDLALLQTKSRPEIAGSFVIDSNIPASGRSFISRGFHYSFGDSSIPIQGQIRGIGGKVNGHQALILSSIEVAEGISGSPIIDPETGFLIGIIQRYHKNERWLAVGIPIAEFLTRWPDANKLSFEYRYKSLFISIFTPKRHKYFDLNFRSNESKIILTGDTTSKVSTLLPSIYSFDQVIEVINKKRGWILLGDPGAGKSISVESIAYEAIQRNNKLPIVIDLSDFYKSNTLLESMVVACRNHLLREYQFITPDIKSNLDWEFDLILNGLISKFENLLDQGNLLIIVDGLDEITANEKECLPELCSFSRRIINLQNNILFTCRALDYIKLSPILNLDFDELIIEPLSDHQIDQFIEKFSPGSKKELLLNQLKDQKSNKYYDLCRTPLFLRLIISGRDTTHSITNKTSVIDGYVEALVNKETEKLNSKVSAEDLINGLSQLAFILSCYPELWINEIKKILGENIGIDLSNLVILVGEKISILRQLRDNNLEIHLRYSHRLLQAALASRAIFQQCQGDIEMFFELIQPYIDDENWLDIISMAASRISDSSKIVQRLLSRYFNDTSNYLFLFLSVVIVAEGGHISDDIKQQAINQLATLIQKGDLSKFKDQSQRTIKASAIGLLTRLATDPYALSRLNQITLNRSVDVWTRLQILEFMLGTKFKASASTILKRIVESYDENEWASISAVQILKNEQSIIKQFAQNEAMHPRLRVQCAELISQWGEIENAKTLLRSIFISNPDLIIDSPSAMKILDINDVKMELVKIIMDEAKNKTLRLRALTSLIENYDVNSYLAAWVALVSSESLDQPTKKNAIVSVIERIPTFADFEKIMQSYNVDSKILLEIARVLINLGRVREGIVLLVSLLDKSDEIAEPAVHLICFHSRSMVSQEGEILTTLKMRLTDKNLSEKLRTKFEWAIQQIQDAKRRNQ